MGTLEQLIGIYARHPVAEVAGDPAYLTLCQKNDKDVLFHRERLRVEQLKRKLEDQVGIQQTRQKQVKYALKLFRRLTGTENQESDILLRLTKLAYFPGWSEKQQAYFNKITAQIETGQDYFLSFTQRNRDGAGNPINSIHRYLIQSYGLPDPIDRAQNELAQMLHRCLTISRYQFRGFFFPAHEDDSAQVAEKLKEEMEKSLVFIQLVQNEMFSKHYTHIKNHCFAEYSDAVQQQKKMIYLFADGLHPTDLIAEDDAEYDLDPWYQIVRGADCVDFVPTPTADQSANIIVNREKLKQRLEEKMQSYRETLWESVPSDLD